jgi:hypothetical protein
VCRMYLSISPATQFIWDRRCEMRCLRKQQVEGSNPPAGSLINLEFKGNCKGHSFTEEWPFFDVDSQEGSHSG